MKLLGVFLSKSVEGVSVCVFLCGSVSVCKYVQCTILVDQSYGCGRASHQGWSKKKPFYSVQYTALCMFEIHCVFQPVGKEVSMQYRLSYSGAIILDLRLP